MTEFFYTGCLSQFAHSPFTRDSSSLCFRDEIDLEETVYNYHFCEQAMMHQKALLFDDRTIANQILAESKPAAIKAFGRKVRGFGQAKWNKYKVMIVYDNNMAKFAQNTNLKARLLKTAPKILVEAAANDRVWGIGYNASQAMTVPRSSWGENLLGQVLTKVRDELDS